MNNNRKIIDFVSNEQKTFGKSLTTKKFLFYSGRRQTEELNRDKNAKTTRFFNIYF